VFIPLYLSVPSLLSYSLADNVYLCSLADNLYS
jgi:hypothetical protein